jgi:hypothetical protein
MCVEGALIFRHISLISPTNGSGEFTRLINNLFFIKPQKLPFSHENHPRNNNAASYRFVKPESIQTAWSSRISFGSSHVTTLAFVISIIASALIEDYWNIWVIASSDCILNVPRRRPIA